MKHLKKLSVVLMMTTLFSVSFTSCIDNEVSPLVEAIYEAQADLIAAQAGVQNAEAALLLAQAANEDANAALLEAQAAAAVSIAQGELAVLLANAGLTDAQAAAVLAAAEGDLALALAAAGLTEAEAAQILADIADQEADAAYTAATREQALLVLVAQTSLDVAELQNDLAIEQIKFDIKMAGLIADMEAAGAVLAAEYAGLYARAMNAANGIMSDLLGAQADLASAELMLVDPDGDTGPLAEVSYAYYLAQLENEVAIIEAKITAAEAHIATLEANAEDPIAAKELLEAEKIALRAEYEALLQTEEAQMNAIAAINFDVIERNAYVSQLNSALSDHNASLTSRIVREGWIANAEEEIEEWELALADYPAALEAAELAVSDAETAQEDAQVAVDDAIDAIGEEILPVAMAGDDAIDPAVTLYEVLWNADLAVADAQVAFDDLESDVLALYGTYQDAIDALALAQYNYDLGIDAIELAVTDAETALDDAEIAWTDANDYYLAKKAIFEAAPAGLTWFDQLTPLGVSTAETATAFPNTRIGIHTDVIATSYAYVTGWVEGPVGTWTATTISAGMVTAIPGTAFPYTGPVVTGGSAPSVLATTGFYVELEADDLSETNAELLDDAVAKLGNDIADGPVQGDDPLGLTDAYSVVWDAQLALIEAQYVLANFDDALVLANEFYLVQKNLYENQVALMAAAQTLLDDAITDQEDAQGAIDDAEEALGTEVLPAPLAGDDAIDPAETLYEVLWNADLDVLDAEAALTELEVCDAVCIQGEIDDLNEDIVQWTEEITNIQVYIDAKYAVVAGLLAELDTLGIEYTFVVDEDGFGTFTVTNDTVIGNSYSDLRAELIAANQVLWEIQRDLAIVVNEQTAVNMLLLQWNASYNVFVNTTIPNLKSDLVLLETDLEEAKAALALAVNAETAAEAHIAYLEALIETLEARHANTLAIAAKYKALMDAALAS